MKKLLKRYCESHQVSSLCEFGAFRDILHFRGHQLSIPMLFGIAGAMGFGYGPGHKASIPLAPDYQLPLWVATPLNPFPIKGAYRVTNTWILNRRYKDWQTSWEKIRQFVSEGFPVIVEVEAGKYFSMIKMPVFSAQNQITRELSIGGHYTVVAGFDDDKKTITSKKGTIHCIPVWQWLTE